MKKYAPNLCNKNKKLYIHPSTLFRIFLIIVFFGEICIYFYYYTSSDLNTSWKNYMFIAVLFPIVLIFITSVVVESFNMLFFEENEMDQKNQSFSTDNHTFFSFLNFFSKTPYLLRLLLFIITIIICYYLKRTVFATIELMNMFIYTFFICLLVGMILFFIYAAISMIFNYQVNIQKLELHFYNKQNLIDKPNSPLQDFHGHKQIDHSE
jgi:hypothetical protein